MAKDAWYEWLFSQIAKSVIKPSSDIKEKIMRIFKTKLVNNITKDYKPKNITFGVNILRTKVKVMKNYQLKLSVKTLDLIYMI